MRVLLLSNSFQHGRGFLDHAQHDVVDFLGSARRIAFVPYAMYDWNAYEQRAAERFRQLGFVLRSIHHEHGRRTLEQADAIFIGGGNTFRLLYRMYEADVLNVIRQRVRRGVPYIGSSAGSIVAGPTLKTTKDMPILQPPSFDALGLVPFQISPHYLDPDPNSTHMGETQEERILQFLEENEGTVVGLREGSMVHIDGATAELMGPYSARFFRRGHPPQECAPGPVDWLGARSVSHA